MDFSNFLYMQQEMSLIAIFVFLLLYDIFCSEGGKRWFQSVGCLLFAAHTIYGLFCSVPMGEAFGGLYISSEMTVVMKNILNIAVLIVFMQSSAWLQRDDTVHKRGEFFTITLVTLLGMFLMISAGNFMMLYIGMETASLPLACLAAFNKYQEKSAEAGMKYILMSAFSSAIMLFGLSFLYGALGTMYFSDMNALMQSSPMVIFGFVLFFVGLAFKISLVPFHLWTADVYEGSPTPVTAYLSVVSKGAAAFALIFAIYHVFSSLKDIWHPILWVLSVVTITVGNLFAIRQKDIKRFFAFSSISQAGYILLGIIAGTAQGMTSVVYYVLVYVFSNLAVFGVISAIEDQSGKVKISDYNGLYKSNPRLSFVMMLAVFSLGGIPPLAGFVSKFFIFAAAAAQGEYLLVFIALLNTVVSLFYYLLIIKAIFINEPEADAISPIKVEIFNKSSLVICSMGILLVGLASCIYEYIGKISFGM